jgi:ribosomal protein S18 acetylase RimI-like enzyme
LTGYGSVDAFVLAPHADVTGRRTVGLDFVGTRPGSRGHGLASRLLEHVIRAAAIAGFECAELIVDSSGDRKALRLYQRLGFDEHEAENVYVLRPD